MDKKIELIFAGRLSYEKWFDLILDFCKHITWSDWEEKIILHIFGSGELSYKITSQNYWFLKYYWWQDKETVLWIWKNCQYSLMPSRFLETFWLSALDSLSLWVPVIWFKKWWLEQFWECIIDAKDDDNFIPIVIKQLENSQNSENKELSKKCIETSRQYSWENRKNRLEKILRKPIHKADILIVSDYSWKIGGIESYISNVIEKLNNFSCSSIWRMSWTIWSNKIMRYISLPFSILNIWSFFRLRSYLKTYPTNLVWRHSVHRVLGRFSLYWISKNYTWNQILTIHDFWLIHPFPSHVFNTDQLLNTFTFSTWIKAGFRRFWWSIILKLIRFFPLVFKYYYNVSIHKQIRKNISTVLVPSEFMKNVIYNVFPNKKIIVFPHAI